LGLASYVAPAPQYEQYAGYAVSQPVPIAPTGYAPVQVFSSLCILASQVFRHLPICVCNLLNQFFELLVHGEKLLVFPLSCDLVSLSYTVYIYYMGMNIEKEKLGIILLSLKMWSDCIQNTKDNPPCNTLFIGNLGEAVNETELRGLFSGQALTPTLHIKSITTRPWEAEFMNTSPSLTRS
jgi:hypothetical protein